jgi:hypothetical protein
VEHSIISQIAIHDFNAIWPCLAPFRDPWRSAPLKKSNLQASSLFDQLELSPHSCEKVLKVDSVSGAAMLLWSAIIANIR